MNEFGEVAESYGRFWCLDKVYLKNEGGRRIFCLDGWAMDRDNQPLDPVVTLEKSRARAEIVYVTREDVAKAYGALVSEKTGFSIRLPLGRRTKSVNMRLAWPDGEIIFEEEVQIRELEVVGTDDITLAIDHVLMSGDREFVTGWVVGRKKSAPREASAFVPVDISLSYRGRSAAADLQRTERRDVKMEGLSRDYRPGFTLSFRPGIRKDYCVRFSTPGGTEVCRYLKAFNRDEVYSRLFEEKRAKKADLDAQRDTAFSYAPLISILVPVYRTDLKNLQAMIDSVRAQSYGNWELCLADGSGDGNVCRKRLLEKLSREDRRIRVLTLPENLGIAGNSNAARDMAKGDWFALLDHDDLLEPDALYEMAVRMQDRSVDFIYTDEDKTDGKLYFSPHFKPDFSRDYLRSNNYICHFLAFRRDLIGADEPMFGSTYDGAQDYDLILRLSDRAGHIVHIPRILYHWQPGSTALGPDAKDYAWDAGLRAAQAEQDRMETGGIVSRGETFCTYRTKYPLKDTDLVSIIIPNCEQKDVLKRCIESVLQKTTYPNYEILIVENNSTSDEIFAYYDEVSKDDRIRVLRWDGPFNYSAINNYGVKEAAGKYLLFLNNDVEVITPDWMSDMVANMQRSGDDIGAVGVKLLYPDDTIQHAGVIVGLGGIAGHAFYCLGDIEPGYFGRVLLQQDYSAVTAACMMMPKALFEQVGGFDEALAVAYNDVDLCLKIRAAGKHVIYLPDDKLYHYESLSRGYENESAEKKQRFEREVSIMEDRWKDVLAAGDPFYNVHLTKKEGDFSLALPEGDAKE